jgi:26 proteasome complex subunit DSS1
MSGEQGGTGDHLWEDNWDDDDVEDDFGKALRAELEKQSGKAGQPMAT